MGIINLQISGLIILQRQCDLPLSLRELERHRTSNNRSVGVDIGTITQLTRGVLTPSIDHAVIGMDQDMITVGGGGHTDHIREITLTSAAGIDQRGDLLLCLLAPVTQNRRVFLFIDTPHIYIALFSDNGTIIVAGINGGNVHTDGGILIGLILDPGGDKGCLFDQAVYQRPQTGAKLLHIVGIILEIAFQSLDLIVKGCSFIVGCSQFALIILIHQTIHMGLDCTILAVITIQPVQQFVVLAQSGVSVLAGLALCQNQLAQRPLRPLVGGQNVLILPLAQQVIIDHFRLALSVFGICHLFISIVQNRPGIIHSPLRHAPGTGNCPHGSLCRLIVVQQFLLSRSQIFRFDRIQVTHNTACTTSHKSVPQTIAGNVIVSLLRGKIRLAVVIGLDHGSLIAVCQLVIGGCVRIDNSCVNTSLLGRFHGPFGRPIRSIGLIQFIPGQCLIPLIGLVHLIGIVCAGQGQFAIGGMIWIGNTYVNTGLPCGFYVCQNLIQSLQLALHIGNLAPQNIGGCVQCIAGIACCILSRIQNGAGSNVVIQRLLDTDTCFGIDPIHQGIVSRLGVGILVAILRGAFLIFFPLCSCCSDLLFLLRQNLFRLLDSSGLIGDGLLNSLVKFAFVIGIAEGFLGHFQEACYLLSKEVAILQRTVDDGIVTGESCLLRQSCQQVLSVVLTHHVEVLCECAVASHHICADHFLVIFHCHKHGLGLTQSAHNRTPEVIQFTNLVALGIRRVKDGLRIGGNSPSHRHIHIRGQTLIRSTGSVDKTIRSKDIHIVVAEVDLHSIVNSGDLCGTGNSVVAGGIDNAGAQLLAQVIAPDIDRTVLADGGGTVAIRIDLDNLAGVRIAQVAVSHTVDQTRNGLIIDIVAFVVHAQRATLIAAPAPYGAVRPGGQAKTVAHGHIHSIVDEAHAGADLPLVVVGLSTIGLGHLVVIVAAPSPHITLSGQCQAEIGTGSHFGGHQCPALLIDAGVRHDLDLSQCIDIIVGLIDRNDDAAHCLSVDLAVFIHRSYTGIGGGVVELIRLTGRLTVHIEPVDQRLQLHYHIILALRHHDSHPVAHKFLIGQRQVQRVNLIGKCLEVQVAVQGILAHGNITQLTILVVTPSKDTAVAGNGGGQAVSIRPVHGGMAHIAVGPDNSLENAGLASHHIAHVVISGMSFTGQNLIVKASSGPIVQAIARTHRGLVARGHIAVAGALLAGVVGSFHKDSIVLHQKHYGVAACDLAYIIRSQARKLAKVRSAGCTLIDLTALDCVVSDGIDTIRCTVEVHHTVFLRQKSGCQHTGTGPSNLGTLLCQGILLFIAVDGATAEVNDICHLKQDRNRRRRIDRINALLQPGLPPQGLRIVARTPDEKVSSGRQGRSIAFLGTSLADMGTGIDIHDLHMVDLGVALQVTQSTYHRRPGHIAAAGAIGILTIVVTAPDVEQAFRINGHSKVGTRHDLDDLGFLIGNGNILCLHRHKGAVYLHLSGRICFIRHQVIDTLFQNDRPSIRIRIMGAVTGERHFLRFALKAANAGRAKTQHTIVIAAPSINLTIGLQRQRIFLAYGDLSKGNPLSGSIPILKGLENRDTEFHCPGLAAIADTQQDHGIAHTGSGNDTSIAHRRHIGIQAHAGQRIAISDGLGQRHDLRCILQQIESSGHSVICAQIKDIAHRKCHSTIGALIQNIGVGCALDNEGLAHRSDCPAEYGILSTKLLHSGRTHSMNRTILTHIHGVGTAGGGGGAEDTIACYSRSGGCGSTAHLTQIIPAQHDELLIGSHHGHAGTTGQAGHFLIGIKRQVIPISKCHIQLDGRSHLFGAGQIPKRPPVNVGIVITPTIHIAGHIGYLNRSTAVCLLQQEYNSYRILVAGRHSNCTVGQQNISFGLVVGVCTDTHCQVFVVTHGLDGTIGLEDIGNGIVAGTDSSGNIAHPIQHNRRIVRLDLVIGSKLIAIVVTHTKDVVADHIVRDDLAILIDTVAVHALDHQGESVRIISTAHGDVHDLLDIILLARSGCGADSLCPLQHLGGPSHPLGRIAAQAQLAFVIAAPGPDSAIILQSIDKVAGGCQLTNIVQVFPVVLLNLDGISIGAVDLADTQLAVLVGTPGPDGTVSRQGSVEAGTGNHLRVGYAIVAGPSSQGIIIHTLIHTALLANNVDTVAIRLAGRPDLHLHATHGQGVLGQRHDDIGSSGRFTGDDGQLVISPIVHLNILVGRNTSTIIHSGTLIIPSKPDQILIIHAVFRAVQHVKGRNLRRDGELEVFALSDGDSVVLQHKVGSAHADRLIGGVAGGITQAAQFIVLTIAPQRTIGLHDQGVLGLSRDGVDHRDNTLNMVTGVACCTGRDHVGHTGYRLDVLPCGIQISALTQTGRTQSLGHLDGLTVNDFCIGRTVDDLVIIGITHRPQVIVRIRDLQVFRDIGCHGELQLTAALHHRNVSTVDHRFIDSVTITQRDLFHNRRLVIDIDRHRGAVIFNLPAINAHLAIGIAGLIGRTGTGGTTPGLDLAVGSDGYSVIYTAADCQGTAIEDSPVRLRLTRVTAIGVVTDIAPGNDLTIRPQNTHISGDLIRRQLEGTAENCIVRAEISGQTYISAIGGSSQLRINKTAEVVTPAPESAAGIGSKRVCPGRSAVGRRHIATGGDLHHRCRARIIASTQTTGTFTAQNRHSIEVDAGTLSALAQLLLHISAPGPDNTVLIQCQGVVAAGRDLHDIGQSHIDIILAVITLDLNRHVGGTLTSGPQLTMCVGTPSPDSTVTLQSHGVIRTHGDGREHHSIFGHRGLVADHIKLEEALITKLVSDYDVGEAGSKRSNDAAVVNGRYRFILRFKLQLAQIRLISPQTICVEAQIANDGIHIDLHFGPCLDSSGQNSGGIVGNSTIQVSGGNALVQNNGIIVNGTRLAIHPDSLHLQIGAAAVLQYADRSVLFCIGAIAQLAVGIATHGIHGTVFVVINDGKLSVRRSGQAHDIVNNGLGIAVTGLAGPNIVSHRPIRTPNIAAQLAKAIGAGSLHALVQITHITGATGRDHDSHTAAVRLIGSLQSSLVSLRMDVSIVRSHISHGGAVVRNIIVEGGLLSSRVHIILCVNTQLSLCIGAPGVDLSVHVNGHHAVTAGGQSNIAALAVSIDGTDALSAFGTELALIVAIVHLGIAAQAQHITTPGQNMGGILVGGNSISLGRSRQAHLYRSIGPVHITCTGSADGVSRIQLTILIVAHAIDITFAVQQQRVGLASSDIHDLSTFRQQAMHGTIATGLSANAVIRRLRPALAAGITDILHGQEGGRSKVPLVADIVVGRLKAQLTIHIVAPDKDLAFCGQSQGEGSTHGDLLHQQVGSQQGILTDGHLLGRGGGHDVTVSAQTQTAKRVIAKSPHRTVVPKDHSKVLTSTHLRIGNAGNIAVLFGQRHHIDLQEAVVGFLIQNILGNDVSHAECLGSDLHCILTICIGSGNDLLYHIGIQRAEAHGRSIVHNVVDGSIDKVKPILFLQLEHTRFQPQDIAHQHRVLVIGQIIDPPSIAYPFDLHQSHGLPRLLNTDLNRDSSGRNIGNTQLVLAIITPAPSSTVFLHCQSLRASSGYREHIRHSGNGSNLIILRCLASYADLAGVVRTPGIDLTTEAQSHYMVAGDGKLTYRLAQNYLSGNRIAGGDCIGISTGSVCSSIGHRSGTGPGSNCIPAQLALAVVTPGPNCTVCADDCCHVAAGVDPPSVINRRLGRHDLGGHICPHRTASVQRLADVGGGPTVTQLTIGVVTPGIDVAIAVHSHDMGFTRSHGDNILQIDIRPNGTQSAIPIHSLGMFVPLTITVLIILVGHTCQNQSGQSGIVGPLQRVVGVAVQGQPGTIGASVGIVIEQILLAIGAVDTQYAPGILTKGVDISILIHCHGELSASSNVHDIVEIGILRIGGTLSSHQDLGGCIDLTNVVTIALLTMGVGPPGIDISVLGQSQHMVGTGHNFDDVAEIAVALRVGHLSRRLTGSQRLARGAKTSTQLAIGIVAPSPDSTVRFQGSGVILTGNDHRSGYHRGITHHILDLLRIRVTELHFQPLHDPTLPVADGDDGSTIPFAGGRRGDPVFPSGKVTVGSGQSNILHLAGTVRAAVEQVGIEMIMAVNSVLIHHKGLILRQNQLIGKRTLSIETIFIVHDNHILHIGNHQRGHGQERGCKDFGKHFIAHLFIGTVHQLIEAEQGQQLDGFLCHDFRLFRQHCRDFFCQLDDSGGEFQIGVSSHRYRHQGPLGAFPAAHLIGGIGTGSIHGTRSCKEHGEVCSGRDNTLSGLRSMLHSRSTGIGAGHIGPLLSSKGIIKRTVAQLTVIVPAPDIDLSFFSNCQSMSGPGGNILHVGQFSHIVSLHCTHAGAHSTSALAQLAIGGRRCTSGLGIYLSISAQRHHKTGSGCHGSIDNIRTKTGYRTANGPCGGQRSHCAAVSGNRHILHVVIGHVPGIFINRFPFNIYINLAERVRICLIIVCQNPRLIAARIDPGVNSHISNVCSVGIIPTCQIAQEGPIAFAGVVVLAPGIDVSIHIHSQGMIGAGSNMNDIIQEIMVSIAVLSLNLNRNHHLITHSTNTQLAIDIIAPSPDSAIGLQSQSKAVTGNQHGLGEGIILYIGARVLLPVVRLDHNGDLLKGAAGLISDGNNRSPHRISKRHDRVTRLALLHDLHQPAVGSNRDLSITTSDGGVRSIGKDVDRTAHINSSVSIHQNITDGHSLIFISDGYCSVDIRCLSTVDLHLQCTHSGIPDTAYGHHCGYTHARHLGTETELSLMVAARCKNVTIIADHNGMVLAASDEADPTLDILLRHISVDHSHALVRIGGITQLTVSILAPGVGHIPDRSVLPGKGGGGKGCSRPCIDSGYIFNGLCIFSGIVGGKYLRRIVTGNLITHAQTAVVVVTHSPDMAILGQHQGMGVAGRDGNDPMIMAEGV